MRVLTLIGLINQVIDPSKTDSPEKTSIKQNEKNTAFSKGLFIPTTENTKVNIASLVPIPDTVIGNKPIILASTIVGIIMGKY